MAFSAVFPDLIPDAGRFRALAPVRLVCSLLQGTAVRYELSGRTRAHSSPYPKQKTYFCLL